MEIPKCTLYSHRLDPKSLRDGAKLPAQILCTRILPPNPELGFINIKPNQPEMYWEDCTVERKGEYLFVKILFDDFQGTRVLPLENNGQVIFVG